MSDPVNHHYLPVFYLKQWVGPDKRIVRYYRPHKTVHASRIAPSNTGYEPFLYSLNAPPEKRQIIERDFMGPAVDGPAAIVLKDLIKGKPPELSNRAKCNWARFLVSLLIRHPQKLAELHEMGRSHIEESLSLAPEEYDAVKGPDDPPTFLEWVQTKSPAVLDNVSKFVLPKFIDDSKSGQELLNFKWLVLHFDRGEHTLLTSDRPLVMTDGLGKDVASWPCLSGLA